MQSLLILGRQPELGLAELESLYGSAKLRPVGNWAALLDVDPCLVAFNRLGGSVKFAKVLSIQPTTDWAEIEKFLLVVSPDHSRAMPKGKMQLGLSAYGFNINYKQVLKTAISLKQAIRSTGRSVRVIPNKDIALNSAQVIHNRLTSSHGWELIILRDNQQTIIAQTVIVQDIDGYARRDRNRPARDPRVGMLPPKLAQIIINLAVGPLPPEASQSVCEIPPAQPIPTLHFSNQLLLDPFCGTGVILQEAAIMGYDCLGTDIDKRMVDYTEANINWLRDLDNSPLSKAISVKVAVGDALTHKWIDQPKIIASEMFLGKALPSLPSSDSLKPIVNECSNVLKGFLVNLAGQINSGTRLCLAIPAWRKSTNNFTHLPILDSIDIFGYNRVSFKYSKTDELIYYRPNQVVGRELLVLSKR